MQQFNIDISQPRGPLVLYVSQGDSLSRFFEVTVTDNGAPYTPPAGSIFTVRFGAPGLPAGWYDTITEQGGGTHPAVVVDENTYTVEIAEQAVSKPGQNALVLIVSDATGYTLASWAFELQVAAVPGYDAPEATVYYNALTEQVAQVLASTTAAASSATLSESWAVGGTGTREGENTNNARYWAEQAQQVSQWALGWYETEQALQAAHPTGENGQWAIIGSTDTIWTWDSDTSAWVDSGAQVDLSNYYTKAQADAAFATAAQGTKADTAVQSINGKTGTAVTLDPQDVGGISTYTCATSGTVHALAGTGNNIKFVADAAFAAGDSITVNGQAVTAQTQAGEALSDGAWASGVTVACWLDGATLTVSGGGGIDAIKNVIADGAGAHNSIYRGKNLGTSVTAEQYKAISDGTFAGLYVGDYWTIGGVNYRIAAFDYYLNCGDTSCTKHHVVLVPDTCLYNHVMNDTNITTGAYVGSKMYTEGLEQAKTTIKAAFSGHVLKHRIYLTNAVANGRASGGAWRDSEVDLMCEQMVYGSGIFSPVSDGSNFPANYRVEKSQLPLFQHEPSCICNRDSWWLRDVISASYFARVRDYGHADFYNASDFIGVRPAFCIC